MSQRIIATTLVCSRNTVADKLKRFEAIGNGEGTLADSNLDRIVYDSYTIVIDGEESMRKRNGIA